MGKKDQFDPQQGQILLSSLLHPRLLATWATDQYAENWNCVKLLIRFFNVELNKRISAAVSRWYYVTDGRTDRRHVRTQEELLLTKGYVVRTTFY
jgi:hypothetical protein